MDSQHTSVSITDRSVKVNKAINSNIVTGDGVIVMAAEGDLSPDQIIATFKRITRWALRSIRADIPGLHSVVSREEISSIESHLHSGLPVVVTGVAGSGKSNIARAVAKNAEVRKPVLFLDARQFLNSQTAGKAEAILERLTIHIEKLSQIQGCVLIIDQFDNVLGSPVAGPLLNLARDCSDMAAVEILVVARNSSGDETSWPDGEKDLRDELLRGGFREVVSDELDQNRVAEIFSRLNISAHTEALLNLGRNLLHLRLIAHINLHNPGYDFSRILLEVDLWTEFTEVIRRNENPVPGAVEGDELVELAQSLATEGMKCLDYSIVFNPTNPGYRRLLSWRIIRRRARRVCYFVHDNLLDFLYAQAATDRGWLPSQVFADLPVLRARDVIIWMEKLYSRQSAPQLEAFLKEIFNG